jgi:hypothetical protein
MKVGETMNDNDLLQRRTVDGIERNMLAGLAVGGAADTVRSTTGHALTAGELRDVLLDAAACLVRSVEDKTLGLSWDEPRYFASPDDEGAGDEDVGG